MEPATAGAIVIGLQEIGKAGARLLERALGQAADEFGLYFLEKVKELRARRGKVLNRAGQALEDLGVEPVEVPIKLLAPIIDKAGLEEDEGLSTRWSALLANAAHPGRSKLVLPIFPHILSLLAPQDALVLELIAERQDAVEFREVATRRPWVGINGLEDGSEFSRAEIEVAVSSLLSHNLIERQGAMDTYESIIGEQPFVVDPGEEGVATTPLGKRFLLACRMPPFDDDQLG